MIHKVRCANSWSFNPDACELQVRFGLWPQSKLPKMVWKRAGIFDRELEVLGCTLSLTQSPKKYFSYLRFAMFSFDISRGPASPSSSPLHCLPSSTVRHFQREVNRSGAFSNWFLIYCKWIKVSLVFTCWGWYRTNFSEDRKKFKAMTTVALRLGKAHTARIQYLRATRADEKWVRVPRYIVNHELPWVSIGWRVLVMVPCGTYFVIDAIRVPTQLDCMSVKHSAPKHWKNKLGCRWNRSQLTREAIHR